MEQEEYKPKIKILIGARCLDISSTQDMCAMFMNVNIKGWKD